jgi:transposase
MARASSGALRPIPLLTQESVYVGIDVGKQRHVAGFVSVTLLGRHGRFEGCPAFAFEQSREGFRKLVERMSTYAPLEHVFVLLEKTGHYHTALVQYLLDLDMAVYLMHVQSRISGLLKTDKRDALGLANHLYNQLELGALVANKTHLVRRAVPPTEAAALLRGLIRHRYELVRETTRRKNKLTAICDELFPEFTTILKDPNGAVALAIREQFPTPHAVATASMSALAALRAGWHPSLERLAQLQVVARETIGVKDIGRQRGLLLEQKQLIAELRLLQAHIGELETEIRHILVQCREGRILLSMAPIGPMRAATIIAAIGHIDNFPSAAALKSYCGWAPRIAQSGTTLDRVQQTHGGNRALKHAMYLAVGQAIRMDSEWARLYERLVPRKCAFDERTKTYKGKLKVVGRVAGQMISVIYALLKQDAEVLSGCAPGKPLPEPVLYDPAIHRAHRNGQYRPMRPKRAPETITALPRG